jgi:hypothetical protein
MDAWEAKGAAVTRKAVDMAAETLRRGTGTDAGRGRAATADKRRGNASRREENCCFRLL